MTPGEFIAAFDVIAEAPGGIERLRELVLQLAVRGKLVPQDGGEEPASRLLERIQLEARDAPKSRVSVEYEPDISVDMPCAWESVYIGDAMALVNGRAFKPTDWSTSGVPIVRIQNLNDPNAPYNYCSFSVDERFYIDNGDLLLSWSGTPGTSFGAYIWNGGQAVLNQHIFRCEPRGEAFFVPYLRLAINSRLSKMIERAHGGVGLRHITKGKLQGLRLALPPLDEQHRIVAKVDELMGLIDRLAATRSNREDCRTASRDSALAALRNAATSEEVGTAWTRIAERMDDLFTASADLAPLREAVLQLAVRGKLVPQDSGDESAAVLLEHIAEERARLVRAKKIRKQKPVPDLEHSATAVELPSGWTWTCTAALGIVNPRNVAEDDAMVSFCPMPVIPTDYRQPIVPETRRWGDIKKGYTHFAEGDVVVAKITPCFQNRKSCVMTGLEGGIGAGTTELHVIRIIANKVVPEYLLLFYKSPDFLQMGVATMTGTAGQQRVPREYFAYTPLPLPPLAEQCRIVAKVDELMGLIDRLEGCLGAEEGYQEALVTAAVNSL